ncbi:MFS transporter [Pseudomaricurvus sp. HS19]|uniref:MFS transporter n=1 Tax=Pseudomaricurvus sp. HS19 TaxID=2692626 RepID=UPI00136EF276|nr:MFS transporter [Pseudomaricurvus sp. HS19]MYM63951.1 MFS transporter [Pseudomaricurvus sp. HS19]
MTASALPSHDNNSRAALPAVIAIAIGYVLNPVNSSLVVTAYPHLATVFDVPYSWLSAMVMYFMAATAVAQPLAGGLGDFLGRRNIFLVGISGFTLASGLAGFVSSFNALLVCRVLQAVFSGLIMANGVALLGQVVPKEKFGFYLGVLTSAVVTGTATGFPLGGLLLQLFDWHILFWINVPFGLLALLLALLYLPRDEPRQAHFTIMSFMGVPFVPLAFGLQAFIQGGEWWFYGLALALAVVALAWGIHRSRRSREQFAAINRLNFHLAGLMAFLVSAVQFGVFFMLPAWIGVSLGIEGGLLGAYMSILSLTMLVTSPMAGRWIDRRGPALLQLLMLAGVLGALLLLMFTLNKVTFGLALMALGVGGALSQLISQWGALAAVPDSSKALGNGIYNSVRSAGSLSGNALAALVLLSYQPVTAAAGVSVLHWQLLVFFVPLVVVVLLLRRAARPRQTLPPIKEPS